MQVLVITLRQGQAQSYALTGLAAILKSLHGLFKSTPDPAKTVIDIFHTVKADTCVYHPGIPDGSCHIPVDKGSVGGYDGTNIFFAAYSISRSRSGRIRGSPPEKSSDGMAKSASSSIRRIPSDVVSSPEYFLFSESV